MLSSIGPLGERARGSRWSVTATAYTISSTLGGAALGLLGWLLGLAVPDAARHSRLGLVALAALLLLGAVLDLRAKGGALPSWHRQVDEAWIGRYRGWVTGVGFGAQLGFGLVTIITSATTYAVLLLALFAGHLGVALCLGATFGFVRAWPLVAMTWVGSWEQVHAVFARLESTARTGARVAMVALAGGALLVLALAATPR